MKKEILILSSVGIVALIIGGSILLSQSAKQNSIERQQRMELQVKQAELDYQKEQDATKETQARINRVLLNACIEDAEDSYWSYMELNGTGKRDDERGVSAAQYKWDIAEKNKDKDIDNCYRKYNK
jgi:hypothetical protein